MSQPVSRGTSVVRPILWTVEDWRGHVRAVIGQAGLRASEAQHAQLAAYMEMLQRWNGTYNLTALRQPEDMLTHHLADCLAVVQPLRQQLGLDETQAQAVPAHRAVLDVGSGGGLPGVVLAILSPALVVTCVDTVGKKAAFIRQVAAELKLPNLKAEHARVEKLTGQYDVIASRAFASLADFVNWTMQLLAPTGVWMAMKAKLPTGELDELPPEAGVLRIEPLSVPGLEAERCLVWLTRHRGTS